MERKDVGDDNKNTKAPSENTKLNNNHGKSKAFLEKIPYKKWWFWAIPVGIIALICGGIYIATPKYDYEERDVNGMVVSEACKIAKEHGWKVLVKNSYKGNSDCYNTDKIVYWYVYKPQWGEAWLYYTLPNKVSEDELVGMPANEACKKVKALGWEVDEPLRQNVPGNYLEVGSCNSVTAEVEEAKYSDESFKVSFYVKASDEAKASSDNKSSKNNETTPPSSNNQTSQNNSSSEWKQFLKDYEAWVDKYVAFMKKYKNASTNDMASMMSEYSSLMSDLTSWSEKSKNMQSNLSGSDLTEYLNTLSRITQKLSSI